MNNEPKLIGRLADGHVRNYQPMSHSDLDRTQTPRGGDDELEPSGSLAQTLHTAWSFIYRQRWFVALGLVLGGLLAPLALVIRPPDFMATATVMIDTSRIQILNQPGIVGDAPFDNAAALESQLEIMRSSRVAQKVMDKLDLRSLPSFQVGERTRVSRIFGPELARILGREPIRTEAKRERYRTDLFASGLTVRRVPGTFAVDVTYRTDSAEDAARFANAVAELYLEVLLEIKQDVSRRAGEWLNVRVDEIRDQLASAQRTVNKFKADNNLMSSGGQQPVERRVAELNAQLSSVQSQEREVKAKLNRVDVMLSEYRNAQNKPALPEQMNNQLVTKLREQLFELSNRAAEWQSRYGTRHEAVEKVRNRMAEINAALREELHRLAESYRSELKIAQGRIASLEAELDTAMWENRTVEAAQIRLRELESMAKSYESVYDGFLRRQTETAEQENFPIPRARIINQATEPLSKDLKRTTQFGLTFMGFGLLLGLAGAFLRELLDRTFRTLKDVKTTLGMPVLSLVPIWSKQDYLKVPLERRSPADNKLRRISRIDPAPFSADVAPTAMFSMALRTLNSQINAIRNDDSGFVLGITSPEPNQGSSTVSSGLAIAAASSGLRVLLIDGDLRNPTLTHAFAPMSRSSLLDVLDGSMALESAMWSDEGTGMHFLPAAPNNPRSEAEHILGSPEMRELMAKVRSRYDLIVIDLPPMIPMTDVMMTAGFVSRYIAIVKWGGAHKEPTRLALKNLGPLEGRVAGVVLNQVDVRKLRLYDRLAARWFDKKIYYNYFHQPA